MKYLDKKHKSIVEHEADRQLCDDLMDGQREVKAKGDKYLTRWRTEKPEQGGGDKYQIRLKDALLFPLFKHSIIKFVSMIKSKPETWQDEADAQNPLLLNMDGKGNNFRAWSGKILTEGLSVGVSGQLVYMDALPDNVTSLDAQQKAGIRPYFQGYEAEDIINFKYRNVSGKQVLSELRLKECELIPDPEEPANEKERDYILRLLLDDNGEYCQQLWIKADKGDEFIRHDKGVDYYPLFHGQRMKMIPFWFFGDIDEQPPLMDLANINKTHYNAFSYKLTSLRAYANPILVLSGANHDPNKTINIDTLVEIASPDGKMFFVSPGSDGYAPMVDEVKNLEMLASIIGANEIAPRDIAASANVTATATMVGQSGQTCNLADYAISTSKTLSELLTFMFSWADKGFNRVVKVDLNTDFLPKSWAPEQVRLWFDSGMISYPTAYSMGKGLGITYANDTPEKEQAAIGEQQPAMLPTNASGL